MTGINVREKHSVSTEGTDSANVEINITATFPYKFVRVIEDEIYKFVENLKKADGTTSALSSVVYTDEETAVIHGSTRENVWENYQKAFPKSKRSRGGVISYFKKWKQFENMKKEVSENVTDAIDEKPKEEPIILTGWQRKLILKHGNDPKLIGMFRKKWPAIKLTHEMVEKVLAEGAIVKKPKKVEEKAIVLPEDGVTKDRFKPGDKVVQISGFSPAHGTGIVQNVRGDGVVTVKFISSTKVLHADNFALAGPGE